MAGQAGLAAVSRRRQRLNDRPPKPPAMPCRWFLSLWRSRRGRDRRPPWAPQGIYFGPAPSPRRPLLPPDPVGSRFRPRARSRAVGVAAGGIKPGVVEMSQKRSPKRGPLAAFRLSRRRQTYSFIFPSGEKAPFLVHDPPMRAPRARLGEGAGRGQDHALNQQFGARSVPECG